MEQSVQEALPMVAENLPNGHLEHANCPSRLLNFPGVHTVQALDPPMRDTCPTGQAVQLIDPLGAKKPSFLQAEHVTAPGEAENCPPGHRDDEFCPMADT
jgi:hypothetical protein